MAKSVSCACGWALRGSEEALVDAFVRHVEEGHGKEISRAGAAAQIKDEPAWCGCAS